MRHSLKFVVYFIACLFPSLQATANNNSAPEQPAPSISQQATIVKAYYKSFNSSLSPIDIKVAVNGNSLTIVGIKNPQTNIWQTVNCSCQPVPSYSSMAKEFNYKSYYQIYGDIYFSGSGLSVSDSSSIPYSAFKAVDTSRSSGSSAGSSGVKSRLEKIREQQIGNNAYSSSTTMKTGYYQIDKTRWGIVTLEVASGMRVVNYKFQTSDRWIDTNCYCERIPETSPLIEEFKFKVAIPGLGTVYF